MWIAEYGFVVAHHHNAHVAGLNRHFAQNMWDVELISVLIFASSFA